MNEKVHTAIRLFEKLSNEVFHLRESLRQKELRGSQRRSLNSEWQLVSFFRTTTRRGGKRVTPATLLSSALKQHGLLGFWASDDVQPLGRPHRTICQQPREDEVFLRVLLSNEGGVPRHLLRPHLNALLLSVF